MNDISIWLYARKLDEAHILTTNEKERAFKDGRILPTIFVILRRQTPLFEYNEESISPLVNPQSKQWTFSDHSICTIDKFKMTGSLKWNYKYLEKKCIYKWYKDMLSELLYDWHIGAPMKDLIIYLKKIFAIFDKK